MSFHDQLLWNARMYQEVEDLENRVKELETLVDDILHLGVLGMKGIRADSNQRALLKSKEEGRDEKTRKTPVA